MAIIAAKRLVNWSSRPNTVEGRRIVACGLTERTAASPSPLVRAYTESALGFAPIADRCTNGRRAGRPRQRRGTIDVQRLHRPGRERAGEVYDRIGARHDTGDAVRPGQVERGELGLAKPALGTQEPGLARIALRDPQPRTGAKQRPRSVAPDKTAAADQHDQFVLERAHAPRLVSISFGQAHAAGASALQGVGAR